MPQMPEESLAAEPSAKSSSLKMVIIMLLVAVLGGCVCLGVPVTIALVVPAVQAARESARKAEVSENMRQIGEALQNYQTNQSALPSEDPQ